MLCWAIAMVLVLEMHGNAQQHPKRPIHYFPWPLYLMEIENKSTYGNSHQTLRNPFLQFVNNRLQ